MFKRWGRSLLSKGNDFQTIHRYLQHSKNQKTNRSNMLIKDICSLEESDSILPSKDISICRLSREFLTYQLLDSCQKEGKLGSSKTFHIWGHLATLSDSRCNGICRPSFPYQILFSKELRLVLHSCHCGPSDCATDGPPGDSDQCAIAAGWGQ